MLPQVCHMKIGVHFYGPVHPICNKNTTNNFYWPWQRSLLIQCFQMCYPNSFLSGSVIAPRSSRYNGSCCSVLRQITLVSIKKKFNLGNLSWPCPPSACKQTGSFWLHKVEKQFVLYTKEWHNDWHTLSLWSTTQILRSQSSHHGLVTCCLWLTA